MMPKSNRILNDLIQEKWNICCVCFVVCYVPIFFFRAASPDFDEIVYKFLFSFVFSILFYAFSVPLSGIWKRLYFIILFLVHYIPGIIVLSSLEIDRSILKQSEFWIIFQTNTSEAREFVSTYLNPKLVVMYLVYTLASAYMLLFKISTRSVITSGKIILIMVLGMALIAASLSPPARSSNYVIDFYSSIVRFFQETAKYNDYKEQRSDKNVRVAINLPRNLPKTFIIIIGESLNRNHMSLYDYPRQTNPLLSKIESDIYIFRNVISSELQTLSSLKEVLTFANSEHPDYYFLKPSIIELFNSLDFQTYWIDNQYDIRNNMASGVYPEIARLSRKYFNLNFSEQDESVVKKLQTILNDSLEVNKFIILHLMGSHLPYKIRYPLAYNKFNNLSDQTSKINDLLSEDQKKVINEYDNTVLYNDFVISSAIDVVKKNNGFSYVLYFSDHGEEVFDTRVFSGRSFENITPGMYQVPFILWLSEDYKKQRQFDFRLNNPYSIDDVIHTIMDLSFVETNDYDSSRSIVSEYFRGRGRLVNGKKIP
jgi:heptose-I-phosphate ethanolaminephosphotransferase